MARIEKWSTTYGYSNAFMAPELRGLALQGEVFGHDNPRFQDGDKIVTSEVRKIDGKKITTKSGTVYELGEPDPKWLEWLATQGKTFDPVNPIKILKG